MISSRMAHFRRSISTQLITTVFGFYFIVTVIVTVYQMASEYRHVEAEIKNDLNQLFVTFKPSITNALWSYDYETLRGILLGIQQIPNVVGAKIHDNQGDVIHAIGEILEKEQILSVTPDGGSHTIETFFTYELFKVSFLITSPPASFREAKTIGKVDIYSSTSVIWHRVEHGFLLILVNSVIKTAALWFIFLFFSKRILEKPLSELTNAVGTIDFSEIENQKIRIQTHDTNELKILEKAFNHMLENLANAIQQIQKNEIEVRHLNENLKLQVQALNQSNHDLEQFAYIASHDLQSPLHSICGLIELFLVDYEDELDEDGREIIDRISKASDRMRSLINDLLAFSSIGRRQKNFEDVDCKLVMEEVLSNLETIIQESKSQIILETPLPLVSGNRVQLIQLFQNLLGNAIKFCNERQPQITIVANKKEKEWLFSVEDNGIGIEDEFQSRIFEVFQRLHEDWKFSGTGIGLAICKKVIENHKGQIWLESVVGEGTTFYFTIPIVS